MNGIIRLLQAQPVFEIDTLIGVQSLAYILHQIRNHQDIDLDMVNVHQMNPMADVLEAFELIDGNGRVKRAKYEEDLQGRDPKKTVFAYPIRGTLMANDQFCGPVGMNTMAYHMQELAHDDRIGAVVLDLQTPGGQAMGTEGMVSAIEYLKQHKPVVTFVRGMATSAGYKIGARGHHIMTDGKGAQVGSIGTMISYLDFTQFMTDKGVREINIVSSLSPQKNKFNFSNPSEADINLIQSDMLNPLTELFQESVKEARPNLDERVFSDELSGDVFMSEAALQLGLIDSIGTYQDAVKLAAELAKNGNKTMFNLNSKTDKKPSQEMTELEKLQQAHQAQIDELNQQHQTAMEALKTSYEQKLEAQATQIAELKQMVEGLAKQVSNLTTKVESLAAAPANEIKDPEGDEGPGKQNLHNGSGFQWGGFGEDRKAKLKEEKAAKAQ